MRTVIHGLTMVNWKGVFYRTLEFHPQVTALEGPNGAGKTTMMIAAYVVLLPEERRLTFTPLGETDRAGERGVWGRLGDGPCYAALDARYGRGERLLAVVHLERGPSSSQKVDLTPVLVRDLPHDVDLMALFLRREEYAEGPRDIVRSLPELKEQARVLGGAATATDTLKEYYRALFDAGLHALELDSEEARTRLNDLLKTSMVGGLSKHLDRGLREFLFRPDPRLGSTVRTMRGALDDCRATRGEVADALGLQRELQDVLEAGQRLFTASVGAVRQRAVERGQLAANRRSAWEAAEARRSSLDEELRAAEGAHRELRDTYEGRNRELEAAVESLRRLKDAHRLAQKLEDAQARLEELHQEHATQARALREAEELHQGARRRADQLRAEHHRAAEGLGEAEKGLANLQNQASRYKWVSAQWRAAIAAWRQEEALPERADFRARAATQAEETASRLNDRKATTVSEAKHRNAFQSLVSKASVLLGREIPAAKALACVDALLAEGDAKRTLVGRISWLREEAKSAQKRASDQRDALELARDLSTLDLPLATSAAVREAVSRTEAAQTDARAREQEQLRRQEREEIQAGRKRDEAQRQKETLQRWQSAHQQASALSVAWEVLLNSQAALEKFHGVLSEQERVVLGKLDANKRNRSSLSEERLRLHSGQAEIDPRLLGARAALGARLLAERFEDIEPSEAAEIEALLGPLASGLLVDDLQRAAKELDRMEDGPEEAWLFVGAETPWSQDQLPNGVRLERSVLIQLEGSTRWARIPKHARLGAASRRRRIEEISSELEELEEERIALDRRKTQIATGKASLMKLFPLGELLESPDPEPELRRLENELQQHTDAAVQSKSAAREATAEAGRHSARLGRLRALERNAALLDEGDLTLAARERQVELQQATEAQNWLATHQGTLEVLQKGRLTLERVPLSEEALAAVHAEADRLQAALVRLQVVLRGLKDVFDDEAALELPDVEDRLRSSASVHETLRAAAARALTAWESADQDRERLSQAEAGARSDLALAEGTLRSTQSAVMELRGDIEALGVGIPTPNDLSTAEQKQEELRREVAVLSGQERQASERVAVLKAQMKSAAEIERAARSEYEGAQVPAERAEQRWHSIRTACEQQGLLRDVRFDEIEGRAEISLTTERTSQVKALQKALTRAGEGAVLLERLRIEDEEDADSERFLRQWSDTRSWLLQRLPVHIFQGEDPIHPREPAPREWSPLL